MVFGVHGADGEHGCGCEGVIGWGVIALWGGGCDVVSVCGCLGVRVPLLRTDMSYLVFKPRSGI